MEEEILKNERLKKSITIALTAGILCSANSVFAEEEVEFQMGQITVTGQRITQTVADTPSNVTIVTNQELENKGAHTLADALTGVNGVTIQNFGGPGEKSIPYILGSDRVVVLIDGKRMNLPQGIGTGSGGVDLNTIMLGDNIDRIEIVHGGASVLYGADAVGGVINIITKKGQKAQTTTNVGAGNHGARYYALSTSGQDKDTHWQISGTQNSGDGPRTNSAYKDKNVSFRLDQDLSKSEAINFTYDYFGSHAGIPGSLSYPSLHDYQDILRHDWSIGYSKEHGDGNRILRYYNNDQVYSGLNSGNFYHHNTVRTIEYQDSIRLDKANLLTWGGEYRKDKVISTGEGNSLHEDTTRALYLQDKYSFNPAANMTVGLRRDDNDLYGTHWLPQVAYLYQANDHTSYFANWSKIFKAPKFDDLYGDDGYGDTGNPNLKAETGWTAETGVKLKVNAVSEAMLSVFKRNITDAIRWVEDSNYTFHPLNLDRYTATGVNASFTTKLSPVITTDIGYTYLDSRDGNDHYVGDPRNTFHIGFIYHEGKLLRSLYGIYQDKSGTTYGQVSGRFIVNSHTEFNCDQETSLYLTVNNLFDKKYQEVNGYPANGRTVLFGIKHTL